MKGLKILLLGLLVTGCHARQQVPTQVVYRFDDHRYLELTGWNCEGELWYIDKQKSIHSQIFFQFYRIFTQKIIHPSERYIAVPNWEVDGFRVSKDYGQTWNVATFSPGPNEPDGVNQAPSGDAISFTVVNDQGFLQTKHSLYMSSKPFDDPRILPDGAGSPFTAEDGSNHILKPRAPGWAWGMVYMTQKGLKESTNQFRVEWQDLPDQVPEVKDYKGWDHMSCDMDAGK